MSTKPMVHSGLRGQIQRWLESRRVQHSIIALIVLNAVVLGLDTSATLIARWGSALHLLDQLILAVFVIEIGLRLYVHRQRFFFDPWSLFDFAVVAIALVPAGGAFSVLRALRILRVLRLLSAVPSMRRMVGGLLAAIPGLGAVFSVLGLFFYIGAVVATNLFGERFPEWFGTLGKTAYTLFQVMTLESWSMGIARPVMAEFPWAWLFFVPFILIATFTLLNLFVGVIVSALQAEHDAERNQADLRHQQQMHQDLLALRSDLTELKGLLVARQGTRAQNGSDTALLV